MTTSDPALTFVLGVGAQKAGTTWLHNYLATSPEFVEGYFKEFHVFDALDVVDEPWTRRRNERQAAKSKSVDSPALHRLAMVDNPSLYFDYFTELLRARESAHVTADMTPAYALLPVARLREIRDQFAARGVRVVPIFLMRDPVDRLWSQLRMQRRGSNRDGTRTDEEVMLRRHVKPHYRARSEYHVTIEALDAAFGSAAHFAFYERLFSEETIADICVTVGIHMHPPNLTVRHNAAPDTATLSEATERQVAQYLAEVYHRVAARFPDVDLKTIWPSANHVL